MEIITPQQYAEYESFVASHPQGCFTQSALWQKVKNNWGWEGVLSRAQDGSVRGACGVLVQKIPALRTAFLYAPRGPVCDLGDRETLQDLKAGADALAEKYRAHTLKWDPDISAGNTAFLALMEEMGFKRIAGPEGFETIQARFNYRLDIAGKSEEEILQGLTQKTRYNVRLAQRKGVEIRVCGPEKVPDFWRLMQVTGERDGFNIRPQEYFVRMLESLGEHARLYMGFYEGEAICGALATNFAGKTCYVYGASDNAHRNVMPNYLMQWEMIRWAVQTGCALYDFQGVAGDLDESKPIYGLYRFKRGFGGYLDELAGEFDFEYRPAVARMVEKALEARRLLSHR